MAQPSQPGSSARLFADVSEMVVLHKVVAARRTLAELGRLDDARFRRCLAFELGIAEYFFGTLLKPDPGQPASDVPALAAFLRFHCDREYGDSASWVHDLWMGLIQAGDLAQARRLGAEAASKGTSADGMHRPGERSGRFFRRALEI